MARSWAVLAPSRAMVVSVVLVTAPRWLYTPIYIALGWVALFYLPAFWSAGGPLDGLADGAAMACEDAVVLAELCALDLPMEERLARFAAEEGVRRRVGGEVQELVPGLQPAHRQAVEHAVPGARGLPILRRA